RASARQSRGRLSRGRRGQDEDLAALPCRLRAGLRTWHGRHLPDGGDEARPRRLRPAADPRGSLRMSEPVFRRATAADVPAIVALLADDVLGAAREKPGDPGYAAAFEAIEADPNQLLAVAEEGGRIVGCLQLT